MENYLKMLSRAVFLTLFSLFPFSVFAQATADELLDGYVSASANKENVTPYITKINQVFKNYRKEQQTVFRGKIYDRIKNDTIAEQIFFLKKVALIDLYALLADSNDSKLDDLYFQKGEICGLHTGDTIMLKECITSLKLSDKSKTPVVNNNINILQGYLEDIRNYLPVSKRLDGVWVSHIMYKTDFLDIVYTPSFVLNINHGKVKFENVGYATKLADISFGTEKVKNDENTYPQSIIDIGKDKVYMVWSNEKIKIPNQSVALTLGQTVGDITTNAVTETASSLVGNIGGDIVGGIAGNIIGGAIMDLFAPSKKMYVLELELEMVNDYELDGRQCLQVIEINGNGKPDVKKEEKDIHFVKYDIKSGVYFGSFGNRQKYVPGYKLSKAFPSQYTQLFTDLSYKYQKGIHSSTIKTFNKFQSYFCPHQIRKLIYFNEQKMLNEGCKMSVKWHQLTKEAYLGVYFQSKEQENNIKGAYVSNVDKDAPAYLFGIKHGDVILSADGFEIKNHDQLLTYLASLHPYDWTTFHIRRGNKEIDIQVELTYTESGRTTIYHDNGDIYEGEIVRSVRNGVGVYIWHDGDVYNGEWVNGKQHGRGRCNYNGDIYNGEWANGKLHGKGEMIYANGDKYEGEWANGKRHGKGVMLYANGDIYEGNFMDDECSGQGMMAWKNGNIYQGEWKKNKPKGRGKLTKKNGDVFEGQFQNGQIHGRGIALYADGTKFEGYFVAGRRNGPAIEVDKNGKRFEGSYVNDKKDGRFVEKDSNGNIIDKGTYHLGKRQ